MIEKVVDRDGEVLYGLQAADQAGDRARTSPPTPPTRCSRWSSTAPAPPRSALGRPAAGKTGTATNDEGRRVSSAWFVGYTPQLSTAVMYVRGKGNERLDGWLPSYFGADYPARTWTAVMQRDMEGLPVEEFPPPANVDGDAPDDGPRAVHAAAVADRRRRSRPRRQPDADARRRARRRRRPPTPTPHAVAERRPAARPAARPTPHSPSPPPTRGAARAATPRPSGSTPAAGPRRPRRRRAAGRRAVHAARWPRPPDAGRPGRRRAQRGASAGRSGGRAGRHRWWTPVRVVLALTAVCFALGHGAEGAVLRRLLAATARRATPRCATPTCPTSTPAAASRS